MAKKSGHNFYGSPCKGTCQGHQAGYDYAANGGTQFSGTSPSFNNGMRVEMGIPIVPVKNLKPKK